MDANNVRTLRWTSGINALLGVWIILAPWIVGFGLVTAAVWNSVIVGALIALFAAVRLFGAYGQESWSWLNLIFGVWLILAPFIFGYGEFQGALWTHIISGVVVGGLAWASASATRRAPT